MVQPILFSVIVPVYNVEPYLETCICSVLGQTYPRMELILVNDGSTDSSGKICDRYGAQFENVKVLHKANQGLSCARNDGVKLATGEYAVFLDSDDYWDDPNVLARLAERLSVTKADVLNYSYKKIFEDTGKHVPYFRDIPPMPLTCTKLEEQLAYLTSQGLYIASACNKVIKRELLQGELQFRPHVFSEDVDWCAKLMLCAKSMDFICENFYCYRQRSSSIRYTINRRKCQDLADNICHCLALAKTAPAELQTHLCRYTAYQYGTFFMVQAQAEDTPEEQIEQLAEHDWILKYHAGNHKLRVLSVCCKFIGYRATCKLIRFLLHRKK